MLATLQNLARRLPPPIGPRLAGLLRHAGSRLESSAFGRNALLTLAGTVLGQALGVVLAPVLTRLYSPQDFGTLGVFMAVTTILGVVGALCFEIAIPAARDDAEAATLLAVGFASLLGTTALLAGVMAVLPGHSLATSHLAALAHARSLIPLGFAFIAGYHLILYYAIRKQDFAAIAQTRITQGVCGPLSQIGLGAAGLGAPGLCLGFLVGQSAGTYRLFHRLVWAQKALRAITLRDMGQAVRRYRAYPLIASWGLMIDMAGAGQIAYLMAAWLYPGALAGYMYLSERVVGRPLVMISTSMLSVYMGEIGRTAKSDPAALQARFAWVVRQQLVVGAAWVIVADGLAILVFPALFGAAWRGAVPYLLALSLAFLLINAVQAVTHTLQVLGQQALAATWQVGRLAAIVAGFVLAARQGLSALQAIACYAAIQSAACLILLAIMRHRVARHVAGAALARA